MAEGISRDEFNQRFTEFENRVAPFIERSTIALERIAEVDRRIADSQEDSRRTFDRVFDGQDKLGARVHAIEQKHAVEEEKSRLPRRVFEWGMVGSAITLIGIAGRKLGIIP